MKGILFILCLMTVCEAQAQRQMTNYMEAIALAPAASLREVLLQVPHWGFNPELYWNQSLESQYQQAPQDPTLKQALQESYIRLLMDSYRGVINPDQMPPDIKVKQKSFPSASEIQVQFLARGSNPQALFEQMQVQNPLSQSLLQGYRFLRSRCADWQQISFRGSLKVGASHSEIPALKKQLRNLGYKGLSEDNIFDQKTSDAIREIQSQLRMRADGQMSGDSRLLRYLNTSCEQRLYQMRADLDKARWLPSSFGERYVFVNLAFNYVHVLDKTKNYSWVSRVINGRVARKTPTMVDRMTYIAINPFWTVPPTIFREDKVEELRNMNSWEVASYFERNNYEVWDSSFSRRLDPRSIDWNSVIGEEGNTQVYIRQRPFPGNALGGLKFMLTNSFAIYLHDTNQRELFSNSNRLISSGCVRVQNPLVLAEFLLQGTPWTRERIEYFIAKPGEVLNAETRVNIPEVMPVYMIYASSQYSQDGVLRFTEDNYNHFSRMQDLGLR